MLGAILLSTLAAATPASAHQGCGGHEGLGRRNELITGPAAGSAKFAKRQDVTIDTGTYGSSMTPLGLRTIFLTSNVLSAAFLSGIFSVSYRRTKLQLTY